MTGRSDLCGILHCMPSKEIPMPSEGAHGTAMEDCVIKVFCRKIV